MGLYQLRRTRIPRHAAVNETVNAAGRGRTVVNAVLRRYLREEKRDDREPSSAPRWACGSRIPSCW